MHWSKWSGRMLTEDILPHHHQENTTFQDSRLWSHQIYNTLPTLCRLSLPRSIQWHLSLINPSQTIPTKPSMKMIHHQVKKRIRHQRFVSYHIALLMSHPKKHYGIGGSTNGDIGYVGFIDLIITLKIQNSLLGTPCSRLLCLWNSPSS